MKKYLPFINWLPSYKKGNFAGDFAAGITVGVMLIPQGMAYSMLAGLPPIYGLYAATIPLIIYALLGTSRQLAVGPVAMVSLLISSGIGAIAETGTTEFIALAILLAFMVGVIQFLMGVFRLGFLVNFLAHPVIAGFTSAAAIIIGFSQLKHILGIKIPRGHVYEIIQHAFSNINLINTPTLILGLSSIALLLFIKKINRRIPGPVVIVVVGILAVYFLGLQDLGVKIVKDVPEGFPLFGIPAFSLSDISTLLPIALTIAFIGFLESYAVAKTLEAKHKTYQIVANQELIALGLANIVGSFFKAFPVTGGFSRTAVNDQAGAKTGLASIISALLVIVTLLFLTKYFYYLPNAVLGAIIIVAVLGLINIKEAKHLWHQDKKDFWIFMSTAIATLVIGIEEGILLGIAISIGLLVYNVSYPHIAELGRVPKSDEYRNVKRFDNLELFDDILIFRFDAQLFFANADSFKKFIEDKINANKEIKHIVVEASVIYNLDSTAVNMLIDLQKDLSKKCIQLYFSDVKGPVRDKLKHNGILNKQNVEQFYLSTHDAVDGIKNKKIQNHTDFVLQTK